MPQLTPKTGPDSALAKALQGLDGAQPARDTDFGRVCASLCDLAVSVFNIPQVILKLYDGSVLEIAATVGMAADHILDDLSFSQRKLIPGESLLISDATSDARYFLEAAVLNAPHIRFYVDMPLVCDGVVLGVLALCERQPRHDFTPDKVNLLRQFANSAATTIALAQNTNLRGDVAFELKSQQTRFDLAQDMTGIGYWSVDLKTRDVSWSKGLYAVYGLSPKTYKPRVATQLDIYEAADQQLIIDKFQRAVNMGEDFDFNVTILRRKDKVMRTIRTKGGVELGEDGKPSRLIAIVRDVTEGVSDHEELIKARMAAEDAGAAKSDFLSQITHELRAPLNNILGYARLLNEQRFDNPDVASYALNLLKSAKSLQLMVKDTLDVAAINTAPVQDGAGAPAVSHVRQDAVDVAALVREVVDQFAPAAQSNQTRLTAQFVDFDNPYARIDGMRLRQVLQNLLSNACKFTRGGLISVTASQVKADSAAAPGQATMLRISVRDTGIGMNENQSLTLFGAGQKAGPGLGLSISKAIVDLLGGHIGVVSRLGEGANFWFEIPVQWAEAPAAPVEPAPVHAQAYGSASYGAPAYMPTRPLRAPVDVVRSQVAQSQAPQSLGSTGQGNGGYTVPAAPLRGGPVDEDRINREYLRALLQDMKLERQ